VVEAARSSLHAKKLPLRLWAEAVAYAVYTLNRTLSSTGKVTPYQTWNGGKPNISHLRIFGSKAFIHIPDSIRRKLDPKGREVTFLGYSETSKGYRVLIPETQKVQIVRDIIFDENHKAEERHEHAEPPTLPVHPSTLPVHQSKPSAQDEPTENDLLPAISMTIDPVHTIEEESGPPLCNHENESNENNIEERPTCANRPYPLRTRKPKVWISMKAAETSDNFEPRTYQEAMQSKNRHSWKPAILDEYKSLIENDTWEVVPLPPDRQVIRSKWVFTEKAGHNNTPTRFKARLVAKGYTQKQGIDYDETYAPVVKHDSLRILLSIVASLNLEMIQLDVKTAFLYGVVKEELYLEQPEGFVLAGGEKEVCRLKKCLYGLKQAPRVWNQKFNEFLLLFGLSRSTADPCIYFRRREEELTLIAIWVDDGLVCSSSAEVIKDVLKHLNTYFEMRALPADCFVGMEITRDRARRQLYVNQAKFIASILDRFNMDSANPKDTPADPSSRLTMSMSPTTESGTFVMRKVPYREAVGCLMYLTIVSRPDIAFAVGQVSRYCENPGPAHWEAVKRILAYISGTRKHGLFFSGSSQPLNGFSDADYGGDLDHRRSTTGYIFTHNGGPVAWCSRRQTCTTLSTTEAEYVAASETYREAIWLRHLLQDIDLANPNPVKIHCDNQSAIQLVRNPVLHARTKHINIRYHFIRDQLESNKIDIIYIETKMQIADILTKPLATPLFERLRDQIGIIPVPI
jgi:hypothetical protein